MPPVTEDLEAFLRYPAHKHSRLLPRAVDEMGRGVAVVPVVGGDNEGGGEEEKVAEGVHDFLIE